MNRIKFSEKIIVECDPFYVFDYTQDYSNRLTWDTFLKKADIIDGAKEAGIGVRTYCVAKNGIGMETEYITFNRPKVIAVKMTNHSYLFKSFLGSWIFKETENEVTEVIFLYSFQLRFPFNLASGFVKNILVRNVKQRLSDLKEGIEKKTNRQQCV